MLAAFVGMAVEVEEQRLGRLAPDRLELLPIEAGIGVDVVGMQLEDALAIARGAADEVRFRHDLSDSQRGRKPNSWCARFGWIRLLTVAEERVL